jgi:single-strand DNA-binding protein
MSDGLNKVMLLGNLGADPELRSTTGGQAVLKLRLATAESYLDRNRQRQERTEWHSCVIWGARAEALSRILRKGDRVFIEGGNRTSSYDDKDGNKRYKTEVNVTNVILCGGNSGRFGRPEPGGDSGGTTSGGGFSDEDYGSAPGRDDDLPF